MKIKRNFIKWTAAALAACTVFIGGTVAYLTDFDVAANEFTIGNVDIELKEPHWKPEDNKKLLPTQDVEKDPMITNTGKNDAYIYMEVSMPFKNLVTADANGFRKAAADTELFSYTPAADWTLIKEYPKNGKRVRIYAYSRILKPGETTSALFTKMKMANIIEGQIDGETFDIPVRGYAIQTTNTGGNGSSVTEQAIHAFDMYLNQNKGRPGAVTEA
ncbi:MAG TPA: Camelysin metallo-endopeptidase [Lachnospiraceae bacterium]|nr:Camelysin metallo-endopeptidase [Lachnospiraceae bacterium]